MNLLTCIFTENRCYQAGRVIKPKGVMVHSTGANNPNLRRYVQPVSTTPDRAGLLARLGINPNGNHWNRAGLNVCVHGFIGKLADGSVASVQTLPWNRRGWHAGDGSSGRSANDTHISFEICEDGLDDPDYFARAYREAVELTAMLCKQYGLDPLADGVVICHQEGYRRGIASNHGDVLHWFPRFGKSMDDFRADVAAELGRRPEAPAVDGSNDRNDKEEDGMVYYERLGDVADGYKTTIRKLMERGALRGRSDPDPDSLEDNVLNISEEYCRVMATLDKLGVLG